MNGTCSKCGYEPVVACQHPNKTLTNTGDGSEHEWSCPDCGESGTENHAFGAWTETSNGDYKRECSCGETQTCDHSKTTLSQLNDTEHTVSCTNCPASWSEPHTFNDNGLCECGYQCQHPAKSYLYNSNNNGTHSITCGKCGATVEAAATCVDDRNPRGTCDLCGGPMV